MTDNQQKKRFFEVLNSLKLRFPVAEIAEKTGYSQSTISPMLAEGPKSRELSIKFLKKFCEVFEVDYEYIRTGNKKTSGNTEVLIEDRDKFLVSSALKSNAMLEVVLECLAEILAKELQQPHASVISGLNKAVANKLEVHSNQLKQSQSPD